MVDLHDRAGRDESWEPSGRTRVPHSVFLTDECARPTVLLHLATGSSPEYDTFMDVIEQLRPREVTWRCDMVLQNGAFPVVDLDLWIFGLPHPFRFRVDVWEAVGPLWELADGASVALARDLGNPPIVRDALPALRLGPLPQPVLLANFLRQMRMPRPSGSVERDR